VEANAATLGVRVADAHAVCLSHGHMDHTGGLRGLLPRLSGAELYAHPAAFVPKFARRTGRWQAIGAGVSQEQLRDAGVRVHLSDDPQEVAPGATLTGQVEREPQYVPSTPHLFAEGADGRRVDAFPDDQALVLESDAGLVVVSGCAHSGIINLCRAAQRITGSARLRAVVGGFHLVGASEALLDATIEGLHELAPQAIHPCHCTGEPATYALVRAFPDQCRPIAAGCILEF